MKEKILHAQLELLEWVVRLTLSGMPIGMLRYRVLLKQDELEIAAEQVKEEGRGGDKRRADG